MNYDDAHVTPGYQTHEAAPWCWCGPKAIEENPINGARVWLHRPAHDLPHLESEAEGARDFGQFGGWLA